MRTLFSIATFLLVAAAQASPVTFSAQQFAESSKTDQPVIVGFHSPSCGSCKIQKPNLEAVLNESEFSKVTGLMADFDETSAFRKSLSKPVRGPSTIVIFRKGTEVARIQGVTNKDELRKLIHNAVASN